MQDHIADLYRKMIQWIIFHKIGVSVPDGHIALGVHGTVITQQDLIRGLLRLHTDPADRRVQTVLSPVLHFFYYEGNTELLKLRQQRSDLLPVHRKRFVLIVPPAAVFVPVERKFSCVARPGERLYILFCYLQDHFITVSNKLLLFFISGHAKCRKTDTDKHYQQNPYFFIALPPSYTAPRSRKQNSCCCTQTNPFWKSANFS